MADKPINHWVDQYTKQELVAPNLIQQLKENLRADEQYKKLREQDYLKLSEAGKATNLTEHALSVKVEKLKADTQYTAQGVKPSAGYKGKLYRGDELVWHYPNNPNKTLLHPDFVEAHAIITRKQWLYRMHGYQTLTTGAKKIGIKPSALVAIVKQLQPGVTQIVHEGRDYTIDLSQMKGRLAAENPSDSKKVMVNPELVKQLIRAFSPQSHPSLNTAEPENPPLYTLYSPELTIELEELEAGTRRLDVKGFKIEYKHLKFDDSDPPSSQWRK